MPGREVEGMKNAPMGFRSKGQWLCIIYGFALFTSSGLSPVPPFTQAQQTPA